jgi:hypothetical protein
MPWLASHSSDVAYMQSQCIYHIDSFHNTSSSHPSDIAFMQSQYTYTTASFHSPSSSHPSDVAFMQSQCTYNTASFCNTFSSHPSDVAFMQSQCTNNIDSLSHINKMIIPNESAIHNDMSLTIGLEKQHPFDAGFLQSDCSMKMLPSAVPPVKPPFIYVYSRVYYPAKKCSLPVEIYNEVKQHDISLNSTVGTGLLSDSYISQDDKSIIQWVLLQVLKLLVDFNFQFTFAVVIGKLENAYGTTKLDNTVADKRVVNVIYSSVDQLLVTAHFAEGVSFPLQIDSGAGACLISQNLFEKIPNFTLFPLVTDEVILKDHQGTVIPQAGYPRLLTFMLGKHQITHPVYITRDVNQFLGGLCLIIEQQLNIRVKDQDVTIFIGDPERPHTKLLTNLSKNLFDCTSINEVAIPGYETILVEGKICTLSKEQECLAIIESPTVLNEQFCITSTLQELSVDQILSIPITNLSADVLTIVKGSLVANASPLQVGDLIFNANKREVIISRTATSSLTSESVDIGKVDSEDEIARANREEDEEPMGFTIPEEKEEYNVEAELREDKFFPKELIDEFLAFLRIEVDGLVSKHEYDIGHLNNGMAMDIKTVDDIPVRAKPYHLNAIRQDQIDKALDELTKIGILKRGDSPYTTPVFIISKAADKNGVKRTRIIFDYRALNAKTIKDSFPLPNLKTLLENLQGNSFYSCLDIRSAYYNIPLTEEASKKSAVITARGIYCPTTMTFGLTNCPSHFSRVMSEVLRDIKNVAWYLDDCIIFTQSDSKKIHLEAIKEVLRALHKANLKIHLGKCEFFRPKIKFVGRILSKDGTSPLPRHVQAVKDFPTPTSIKTLQQFLGLCNWLSSFQYNYSQKINGLCKIISKPNWEWTEENELEFQALKIAITENTIKYHINFEEKLYLVADACDDSYAAIMYQVDTYGKEDLHKLETLLAAGKSLAEIPKILTDPVLPKPKKGVPKSLELQGNVSVDDIELFDRSTKNYSCNDTIIEDSNRPDWHNKVLQKIKQQNQHCNRNVRKVVKHDIPDYNLNTVAGETDKIHIVKAVGFHSGLFRGSQLNYTILEKEATAILNSIEYFRDELYCAKKTYIITDSQPFLWALRFRNLGISRIERFCIRLLSLPYKLIISHIAGVNQPADALTRVWKVPDELDKVHGKNYKKAIVVTTPFPIGSIIQVQDLITALKAHPEMVQIPKLSSTIQTDPDKFDDYLDDNAVVEVHKLVSRHMLPHEHCNFLHSFTPKEINNNQNPCTNGNEQGPVKPQQCKHIPFPKNLVTAEDILSNWEHESTHQASEEQNGNVVKNGQDDQGRTYTYI